MSKPTHIHDYFFKIFFQILELAREHIEDYLPKSIVQHFNLSTLALDQTVYVNALRETRSDVVYGCQFNNDVPFRLALLDEHKSELPERDVRFQAVCYKNGIWQTDLAQGRAPTFVFPSVIYHGRKDWVKHPFNASFPGLPTELLPYLAEFDYWLTNLRALTDEDVLSRSKGKIIASAFLTMRHAFQPKYLKQNFAKVVNFDWQNYSQQTWQLFVKELLNYIYNLAIFSRKEFEEAAKPLPPQLNHFAMYTMQSILEEGKELGAKAEALRRDRKFVISLLTEVPEWTDDKIANLAGTTKAFVARIRKELKAKSNQQIIMP
ncbi:MAG: Rpn family recombination-promoting nuclease/putative transposase [Bacteroidota bacterium]